MKNDEIPTKSKRGGSRKGSGRPKGALGAITISGREAATVHAGMAIEQLARLVMRAKPDSTRVMAAQVILDRAFGKARQTLEHSGPGGGPIQTHTTVQLGNLSNEQIDQLEAIVVAAAKPGGDPSGEDEEGPTD